MKNKIVNRLGLEVTIPYDLFKEVNIPNGVKHGLPIVDIMGVGEIEVL